MRSPALASLLGPLLTSCVVAPPPPAVVVVDAPPLAVAAPPTDHAETCVALLAVEPIDMSSRTCFIDARVRDKVGELVFPCAGGDAEARFTGARFRGAVSSGVVDVSLSTAFDFEDGCRWVSQQHIRGSLSGPALEYSYTEAPEPGQSGCAAACAAQAVVAVRPRRGSPAGPQSE